MSLKRPKGDPGTLVVLEHDSKILKGNPLGDPHLRKLGVWLPPGYDHSGVGGKGTRYPVLDDLVGFTGSGLAHATWKLFGDKTRSASAACACCPGRFMVINQDMGASGFVAQVMQRHAIEGARGRLT